MVSEKGKEEVSQTFLYLHRSRKRIWGGRMHGRFKNKEKRCKGEKWLTGVEIDGDRG